MTFKDGIYLTLIALLLGVLVFKGCTKTKCPDIVTNTKYDTVYSHYWDTVYKTKMAYKVVADSIPYITVIEDTVTYVKWITKEYDEKRAYQDSISKDSSYVKVYDTIQHNQILSRRYEFKLKYPVITKTITNNIYPAPKTEFYLGWQIIGNKEYPFYGINGIILVKTKKNTIFGASVGSDIYKQLNLGITYAVKL